MRASHLTSLRVSSTSCGYWAWLFLPTGFSPAPEVLAAVTYLGALAGFAVILVALSDRPLASPGASLPCSWRHPAIQL